MQVMTDSAVAPESALDAALSRIGDRWSLLVVSALLDGPRRFGELQAAIPGIATNVLTQRLRALEAARIVVARPYSRRPPRFSYQLTAAGRELAGALRLLAHWGADAGALEEPPAPDRPGAPAGPGAATLAAPRHQACGTALEVRWWCPTCDQAADEAGGDGLFWA